MTLNQANYIHWMSMSEVHSDDANWRKKKA